MEFLTLGLIALGVGILIGTVGVGGVLLIPAMVALGGLSTQVSMATACSASSSPEPWGPSCTSAGAASTGASPCRCAWAWSASAT